MSQIWLIPAFPLLGFLLNGFLGKFFGTRFVSFVGPMSIGLAFLQSVVLFFEMLKTEGHRIIENLYTWMAAGSFQVNISFQVDELSGLYLLIITGVGFLIHVYSIGYMKGESGYYRFFAYLNLFVFFMLILVLGDSFLLMFVGWEGVGLCSYLLIGYYFEKHSAAEACKKAFLFNRVGDFGVLTAVLLIFLSIGSLEFNTVNAQAAAQFEYGGVLVTVITLLLFLGATGKSAQIPLYLWLPDAMEGPTPVSALIHAATLVTAGVFLIIRCSFFFESSPTILFLVTIMGATTAFFAASVGLVQNDLKRVIAYSTCSQLGYMVFACGLSHYSIAFFHLVNHAFFKALLFLSAGCVIHGLTDEQDLRKMGSTIKMFPISYTMILIGSLALTGFPFFTGFYSKDLIIEAAFARYNFAGNFAFVLGCSAALFTSFYSFRLLFLAFINYSSSYKVYIQNAHEASIKMLIPLFCLSFGSIFFGFFAKDLFAGLGTAAFNDAIFLNFNNGALIDSEFIDPFFKNIPLFCTLIGFILSLFLINSFNISKSGVFAIKMSNLYFRVYNFLSKK